MSELDVGLVIVSGFSAIFSPFSLIFLGVVIGLIIVGIKTKKIIFPIISAIIISIVFVGSYFSLIVFPVGPVLGTIIATNDNIMMTIFLLGAITLPTMITVVGLVKSKRKYDK